jgi:hypothetical protein
MNTKATPTLGKIRKRLTQRAWSSALALSEADTITATAARAIARDLKRKRATIGATANDILAVATSIASARRTATPPAARKPQNAAKRRRYHFGRRVDHLGRYSGIVAVGPTVAERLQSWRDAEIDGAVTRCLRNYARQSPTVAGVTAEFGATDCWIAKSEGWIDYSRRVKSRIGITDAQYHVTVQRGWLRLPRWLRECDGLLTLAAIELPQERANETIYRARWARTTSGGVVVDEGFILRFQRLGERAYTAHAKTIGGARAVITRQLPAYFAAQTERERVRAEKTERIKQQIARKLESGRLNGYDVQVELGDSARAGNCPAGAASWVARHFGGRDSAAVSEILAIADQRDRALLACVAAVRRQT